MADLVPFRVWRSFLALSNDSSAKALIVAFLATLSASVVVSIAAVTLQPVIQENIVREQQARMEQMLRSLVGISDELTMESLAKLELRLVDIEKGTFSDRFDPARYDQRAAARDPNLSVVLASDADVAGIRRRANFAPVFLLPGRTTPALIILPVHGLGYQSTIYAFLALDPDTYTIAGFTVFEQSETPGLGDRIMDTEWRDGWRGKKLFDETGSTRISVVRGRAQGLYEVDGISGATRTGNGVTNMLRFWLGDYGFGPFLKNIKSGATK